MEIKGLKRKIYCAVVGMPDCGKSTFIKSIIRKTTRRDVAVDSFCDEQAMDMTIRSAQLFLRDPGLPYDIVFLDCPGHIFEYEEEARSVLSKAHLLIHIVNERQDDVIPYSDLYRDENTWTQKLTSLMERPLDIIELHSHSKYDDDLHYDADGIDDAKVDVVFKRLVKAIDGGKHVPVDPIETSVRVIRLACDRLSGQASAMCSFGKDSVLMLQLMKMAGCLPEIKVEYPNSGFDLPGISPEFRRTIGDLFGCDIEPFPVIEPEWDFNNHTVQEMMLCKARMLNDRLHETGRQVCFTGIRRDEEGTRAKEKFFSPRNSDGSFEMLKPQLEMFGNELDHDMLADCPQVRVNPLLDLCEADVWYAIRHFGLPMCPEYFAIDGKRYRSLGDWPITTPIDSHAETIDQVCEEVDHTLIPERACRAKQDRSVKFGMEKLRKAGFF